MLRKDPFFKGFPEILSRGREPRRTLRRRARKIVIGHTRSITRIIAGDDVVDSDGAIEYKSSMLSQSFQWGP